jgi:hypothetical protein
VALKRKEGGELPLSISEKPRCQAAVIGKAKDGTKQNSPGYEVQDGEKRRGRREDVNRK